MPRRKLVYGKRPAAASAFCASSSVFTSSSPATSTSNPYDCGIRPDDDLGSVVDALKRVDLEEIETQVEREKRKSHRPLRSIDRNVVVVPTRAKKGIVKEQRSHQQTEGVPKDLPSKTSNTEARLARSESGRERRSHTARKPELSRVSHCDADATSSKVGLQTPSEQLTRTTRRQQQQRHDLQSTTTELCDYARPLLSLSSDACTRKSPTSFASWTENLERYFSISKIAEASYGEVYRLSLKAPRPGFTKADESVLKMIALKPPPSKLSAPARREKARISQMSSIENVASEVQLLQRMTSTPGFTNFREIRVLQGRPCGAFANAWKEFNRNKTKAERSLFPDPSRKSSYDSTQLWAVIEMQDAGTDLERLKVDNVWTCWDVFWGVAIALAKGEEEARFEHRDLHLGNICIRTNRRGSMHSEDACDTSFSSLEVRDTHQKLGFTGLETTIIDYTLSRADLINAPRAVKAREHIAFVNLEAEDGLFEGDGEADYQYDIYRYMRASLFTDSPLSTGFPTTGRGVRTWRDYVPRTNILWLHFILEKLFAQLELPPSTSENVVLRPLAASEERETALTRAKDLETNLVRLRELLGLAEMHQVGLDSAGELVASAVEEGWLDEANVLGLECT